MTGRTPRSVLQESIAYLEGHGIHQGQAAAEALITAVLKLDKKALCLSSRDPIDSVEEAEIKRLLQRHVHGEPVQYITGKSYFYNLELLVGSGVFIPRPETERLVDLTLALYTAEGNILDLGTGSGAIIFSLAEELKRKKHAELIGSDQSKSALAWAEKNRQKLELDRVSLRHGDLFSPVANEAFECIVSNPPYVSRPDYEDLPIEVMDHEPPEALLAGQQGLSVLERIAKEAQGYLLEDGWLISEIGETQAEQIRLLFKDWRQIDIHQDYCQRDRVLLAQRR